jgi:hypothetical protein
VRRHPERFVPVVSDEPHDVPRRDVLVAAQTMTLIGDDGKPTRTVYAGQWLHRDDPLVQLHPHAFTLRMPAE